MAIQAVPENLQPDLPPGQQLVAPGKWPIIGEKSPARSDKPWSLSIFGGNANPVDLTLEQLGSLPQTKQVIDIHCVTRWSKLAVEFEGVLLSDLLAQSEASSQANFISFGSRSARQHSSSLALDVAIELRTLIALRVDGEPLSTDHGGPIRNIVPGRYFYKSVKWLERIELLAQDRLGFWEAESGYHNEADPLKEQRYMSPTIDRRLAMQLISSRNFSRQDLRSIDAAERDLENLVAMEALLRDARFDRANLRNADFRGANLSNAHFQRANLQGANFRGADLEGADLSGANLLGADLSDCSLIGATFFTESNGQIVGAILDASTTIPPSVQFPLVPRQLEYLARHLARTG